MCFIHIIKSLKFPIFPQNVCKIFKLDTTEKTQQTDIGWDIINGKQATNRRKEKSNYVQCTAITTQKNKQTWGFSPYSKPELYSRYHAHCVLLVPKQNNRDTLNSWHMSSPIAPRFPPLLVCDVVISRGRYLPDVVLQMLYIVMTNWEISEWRS